MIVGRKLISVILILIIIIPFAASVGLLSLPLDDLVYQPGAHQEFEFFIQNYNYEVEPYVTGQLESYATVGELYDTGTGLLGFIVTTDFPQTVDLEPGTYTLIIGVREVGEPGGTVGALTAVQRQLKIDVYSNEKDIVAQFDAPNANQGEKMVFRVTTQSWSYQDIDSVYAIIRVMDLQNNTLATFNTNNVGLRSGDRVSLDAEWDNSELLPGNYKAEAEVFYDGQSKILQDNFKLGTLQIKVNNYTREFLTGQINQFDVEVENVWNNPISNVYAELIVDGATMVQTPSAQLDQWEINTLSTFWNVSLGVGEYDAKLLMHYEDTTSEKNINIIVADPVYEPVPIFAVTAVVVLALILLMILFKLFMVGRRERNKGDMEKIKWKRKK